MFSILISGTNLDLTSKIGSKISWGSFKTSPDIGNQEKLMKSNTTTVDAYLKELGGDRTSQIAAAKEVILKTLPGGSEETMAGK